MYIIVIYYIKNSVYWLVWVSESIEISYCRFCKDREICYVNSIQLKLLPLTSSIFKA